MPVQQNVSSFSDATALFRSGHLMEALEAFEPFEASDDMFVRAYPYLHELRLRLITLPVSDAVALQLRKADEQARMRFEALQRWLPISPIDSAHSVPQWHIDPDFDPHTADIELDDKFIIKNWRGGAANSIPDGVGRRGGGSDVEWLRRIDADDAGPQVEYQERAARPAPPEVAPAPSALSVERTPHIGVTAVLPLQPGTEFGIGVYLDSSPPLAGESSRKVVASSGSTVLASVFTSSHFQLKDDANINFVLKAEDLRVTLPTVDAVVSPVDAWTDGIAFIGVTFFVDSRPVGQVTRQIDVIGRTAPGDLPNENVLDIPANGGPVADLTITISADPSRDGRSFWCFVSTPHLEKYRAPVTGPWNLQSSTQQLVSGFMARFTATGTPRLQLISELKGVGVILFDSSPDIFREVFWALIDANAPLKTIAIVSAEPFVPWELMVPNRSVPRFARRQPLGVEFEIGRWTDEKTVAPAWSLHIVDSTVIAPAYSGTLILKNSLPEANMVVRQYPGDIVRPASFASVGRELGTVSRSLVHFVCHGKSSPSGIQSIRLDNDEELSSSSLLGIDGLGELFAKTRPVVFLNACEIGRTTPSLVGLGGFVASFIKLGATAVIAPLWSVEDTIAHEIATLFYQEIKGRPGQTISEIFKKVRAKGYDPDSGRDTYVAYCFYGDPSARIAIGGIS